MLSIFERLVRQEEGQAMTEYGLILAFVVLVVIVVFFDLGTAIKVRVQELADKVTRGTP